MKRILLFSFLITVGLLAYYTKQSGNEINFNTEVKPILNKHCIGCHGGVKKSGDVSFLFEEEAFQNGKSGKPVIVKGDWKASEMMVRILSDDPDERMPLDGTSTLTESEIDILKKWINQGAPWGKHWSYEVVTKPDVPAIRTWRNGFGLWGDDVDWVKNEIDYFVLDKLKEKNLTHSEQANPNTLARRVSLDLIGLAPSPEAVANLAANFSDHKYEQFVDSLLASPRFGEKWASMWLDLARYADSKGYEKDAGRTIWPYRDYVIQSFNEDKPFDQFTIEQIAGDMIAPEGQFPTKEQLIATGFHRNTMTNDEGGTDDEEFRVAAIMDRVNTTWEVWHGTTFACVQCHTHTYDPILHDEYYQYMAFFNNTRDEDLASDTPTLRFYNAKDSTSIDSLLQFVSKYIPKQRKTVQQFLSITEPKINTHDFSLGTNATFLDARYLGLKNKGTAILPKWKFEGEDRLLLSVGSREGNPVVSVYADSTKQELLGKMALPVMGSFYRDTVVVMPILPVHGTKDIYLTLENTAATESWSMFRWIALQHSWGDANQEAEKQYYKLLNERVTQTPVFWEGSGNLARKTHVFERGNWLVKGKEVEPNVPALMPAFPSKYPRNRLGLAQWMVAREHPLTSRVIVNRLWEQLFGRGIVETLEDFGSQGAAPTHPELLDWLSATLMEEDKWQLKAILKRMVMSATYRQASMVQPDVYEKDPQNEWLSRGPRVRLSAEQVRDQALSVSGLLSTKMYGPGVMPPQPDGIWASPYSGESWVQSVGEDRYRRAVYTYWKRTSPYPSMLMFDAPTREFCQSRRIRTNTPLQALVTLNDPVYMEAATNLATYMKQSSTAPREMIQAGYKRFLFRNADEKRMQVLQNVYTQALQNPMIVTATDSNSVADKQIAALAVVANVIMNLDEVVTKE